MKTIAHLFPRVLTGIILKLRTFTQAPEQMRVGSASEDSLSVVTRSHSFSSHSTRRVLACWL